MKILVFLIFISFSLFCQTSYSCENQELFDLLSSLKRIGEVHNCDIEVIEQKEFLEAGETFKVMSLYAHDRTKCSVGDCLEGVISVRFSPKCSALPIGPGLIRWRDGYRTAGGTVESYFYAAINRWNQLTHMEFGEKLTDVSGNRYRVQCFVDPYPRGRRDD